MTPLNNHEEVSEVKEYLLTLPIADRLWVVEFFHHLYPRKMDPREQAVDAAYAGLDEDGLDEAFGQLLKDCRPYGSLFGLPALIHEAESPLECLLETMAEEGSEQGMVRLLKRLAEYMITYRDFDDLPELELIHRYKSVLRRLFLILNDEQPLQQLFSLSKLALEKFDQEHRRWTRLRADQQTQHIALLLPEFKENGGRELAHETIYNAYPAVRLRALLVLENQSLALLPDAAAFMERVYQRLYRNARPRNRDLFVKRFAELQSKSEVLALASISEGAA